MVAYTFDEYNPIRIVAPAGGSGVYVKTPSTYQWDEEDISQPDAGRTEDGLMHKKMIRKAVKLSVSWQNLRIEDISSILQIFDHEYLSIEYLDAKQGTWQTKTFYVGNRTTPMYNSRLNIWSTLSFNLIER